MKFLPSVLHKAFIILMISQYFPSSTSKLLLNYKVCQSFSKVNQTIKQLLIINSEEICWFPLARSKYGPIHPNQPKQKELQISRVWSINLRKILRRNFLSIYIKWIDYSHLTNHPSRISVDSFFQLPRWQNRFYTSSASFLLCGSGCNRLFFYVLWWRVFLKQNKYIFHRRQKKRNNVDTMERKATYIWSYIGRINSRRKKFQTIGNKRRQSDELLSYFIMIRKKPRKSAGREHKFLIWNLFVFHPNIIMANGMLRL